jgi:site-specific DNA-methyltransferase (adenine-specific)
MKYRILQGDNRETLKTIADNSIDAIVTDPPYGIDFLGKAWDANTGALETYQECLRVLKPGGHILAFSAARTYHHLAITLEKAGFEIRDQIMWIYSSGFPKSQDVGKSIERGEKKRKDNALGIKRSKIESGPKTNCPKCNKTLNGTNQNTCEEQQCDLRDALKPADNAWAGWGTALKPAHEPIALARKPIKLSIAKNCQTHGVGALNIDATRVGDEVITTVIKQNKDNVRWYGDRADGQDIPKEVDRQDNVGRFPSNVLGEIAEPYQKYFYCPKVSRRERHIGFELPPAMFGDVQGCYGPDGERFAVGFDARAEGKTKKKKHDPLAHIPTNPDGMMSRDENGQLVNNYTAKKADAGNNHPTVKPIELMKYLIKLVTPPGGIVLDPFNGSGSTGCAAVELGHEYIGCELDEKYVEIAKKRIEAWYQQTNPTAYRELFE